MCQGVFSDELRRTSFQTIRNNKNNQGSHHLLSFFSESGPELNSICNHPNRATKWGQSHVKINQSEPTVPWVMRNPGPQAHNHLSSDPTSFTPKLLPPQRLKKLQVGYRYTLENSSPSLGRKSICGISLIPEPQPAIYWVYELGQALHPQCLSSLNYEMGMITLTLGCYWIKWECI